jgi:AraC family transcriptional regulator, transcriptional activator FtrA
MFKTVLHVVLYPAVFVASIVIFSGVGYVSGMKLVNRDAVSAHAAIDAPAPKPYDPGKPTIAILVGTQSTEVADFLIPYDIFSATGAFNVYSVGLQRQLSALTGGLNIMPDYSLGDLDQLLGKSPDIIVVPNIDEFQDAINPAVLNWLRGHAAQSQLLSICMGARTLAEAGLLDGRSATTHWDYIDAAQQRFPNVQWQRGLRYVDDGSIISSAGITSGIDASLYVVAQRLGLPTAERIANDLHYPDFAFVTDPQAVQYHRESLDNVFYINFLFGSPRTQTGVLLYSGVGEIDLASVLDTYPGSLRMITDTVAPTRQWTTTKHGLALLPDYDYNSLPAVERLLVPGQDAYQLAQADVATWMEFHSSVSISYLHADLPNKFAFDAPVLDLARTQDVPTAQMRQRKLEYRPPMLELSGAGWPWLMTLEPVLVGLASVLILFAGRKVLARRGATPVIQRIRV